MKPAKPAKKPDSSAPGVKMLITAASLAATLGGWALISGEEVRPAPAPASALAPEQTAVPVVTVRLAPLPTLVPAVTPQPRLVTINQPRPAAAEPQPAAPVTMVLRDVNAPVLRDVSAPVVTDRSAPAPAANTRSSR